ncbi:hypothetical protein CAEBREN_01460 [Caenorhabditis brenneri]|uniref:Uncharacterized protein n=1 Tax=Caenorhabditis brenneri TaxID=135651 RepID=G0PJ90_CAEBE|nr:hypothetical protein CAEBREN_01460 [Caenorhabditis brenneri]
MMPITDREISPESNRYPFCIVWTPIPCLTWFFPFIGHMGIANSRGVIRDFAGSFYVAVSPQNRGFSSQFNVFSGRRHGFGWPTRYWQTGSGAHRRAASRRSIEPFKRLPMTQNSPILAQNSPDLAQNSPDLAQNSPIFTQNTPNFAQNSSNLAQNCPDPTELSPKNEREIAEFSPKPTERAQNSLDSAQNSPNLARKSSSFVRISPNLARKSPDLAQSSPNFSQNTPDLAENPPNLARKPPNSAQNSFNSAQTPLNSAQKATNLAQKPPNLALKSPDLARKSFNLTQNPLNSAQKSPNSHNLICDNCHSHVALALNKMRYQDREDWGMVNLAWYSLTKGSFVRNTDILSQYLPFAIIVFILVAVAFLL